MTKIAVIGAGRWGKNHIRTLYELGHLGAIVESDPDTKSAFAEKYPDVPLFNGLDEPGALDYPGYTVAVPAEHHADISIRLLEADKHVLVEKPMALTSNEARYMQRLADEKGCHLMVGHLLLFHPAIQKIQSLIKAGEIGDLQYIYSHRLNLGTVRTEENIWWSFAPHDISIFQTLIGSSPTSIKAQGATFLQPGIPDSTMTTLTYANNVVGHIFVSWLHPFKEHRLVVIGSKAMLVFEDSHNEKQLRLFNKGVEMVDGMPKKWDDGEVILSFKDAQPLAEELKHFIGCIDGRKSNTIIDGEKGLEVLRILEAAQHTLSQHEGDYFVHELAAVDPGAEIGKGSKIWHFSHVLEKAKIGEHCRLGQNVHVANNVEIGNHVKIQNNVSVYEGVIMEDYVFCGPSMVFTNIKVPRSKYPQASSEFYQRTLLKEGASIGANATIVCGTTIGRYAFVAAGTIITKDVPDFAIMLGNPGRQTGWMSEAGQKLNFDSSNVQQCQKSKRWYKLEKGLVTDHAEEPT